MQFAGLLAPMDAENAVRSARAFRFGMKEHWGIVQRNVVEIAGTNADET